MAYRARLKLGSVYTLNMGGLKGKTFRKDEWVYITESEYDWLKAKATERVVETIGGDKTKKVRFVNKFEFDEKAPPEKKGDSENGASEVDPDAAPPRTRTRG